MFFILYAGCRLLPAQDSIKVRKPGHGDEYCWPVIVAGGEHFISTLSLKALADDSTMELRINDDCPVKKRSDIFIANFEIAADSGGSWSLAAQSSFFTGPQKKRLQRLRPGESFFVKNIVVHAPDGFRKMDNFKIILTN